ncbi:MAG TPA: ABC transporter permease subunit [Anaerolineae bacterium]|jgi:NitT/TauT family transport system permease protein
MGLATNASTAQARTDRSVQVTERLKGLIFSYRWLALICVLVIWQIIALTSNIGVLPTPLKVMTAGWELVSTGLFFKELAASMVRILIGFGLGMLLGLIVGVLMGARRFWDAFFQDLVVLGLSLPGLIYALLCVMIFGLGLTAPVVAILLASYPFAAVNIREGVRAIDKELIDMARVYLVNRSRVIRQVILPSLLPFILAAVRVGFTVAWKVAVLTEVFGAATGIGYQLRYNFQLFSMRTMVAWALLFGAVMLVIEYGILVPAERYFARWRPKIKEII